MIDLRSAREVALLVWREGYQIIRTDQYLEGWELRDLSDREQWDVDREWTEVKWNDGRPARTFVVMPGSPLAQLGAIKKLGGDVIRMNDRRYRRYDPFSEERGALHRVFAEVATTPQDVLHFANRFGLLHMNNGVWNPERLYVVHSKQPSPNAAWFGEDVEDWYESIIRMRRLLEVWDLISEQRFDALTKLFVVGLGASDGAYKFKHVAEATEEELTEFRRAFKDDPMPSDAAQYLGYEYVKSEVNDEIWGAVGSRLDYDEDQGANLRLFRVPNYLNGALWYQAAQAIDGNRKYAQCAECNAWFEVTPDVARTNRVYCSTACRSRAYRRRRQEARELHRQGVPLTEIAERIGTAPDTVRRWMGTGEDGHAQAPRS